MDHAKLRQVYEQAKARPPQERAAFLLFNCGGDGAMRTEIQALLDSGREPVDADTARRERMRIIFDEAMNLSAGQRASYVREQCAGDEAMDREIAKHLPWDRASYVREVFAQSLNLPQEQRDPWLRQACRDDEAMRSEILRMLQAYEQPTKPDRGAVMREIFARTMTLPAAERAEYAKQSCSGDDSMYEEIARALPKSEPQPDRGATLQRIFDVAKTKPVEQRDAIHLAYFGGRTYREVADELGIPEGTAKSRMRLGLARIADVLEKEGVGQWV